MKGSCPAEGALGELSRVQALLSKKADSVKKKKKKKKKEERKEMRGEDQKHPGPGEAAGDPWLTIMADKCFSPAHNPGEPPGL